MEKDDETTAEEIVRENGINVRLTLYSTAADNWVGPTEVLLTVN